MTEVRVDDADAEVVDREGLDEAESAIPAQTPSWTRVVVAVAVTIVFTFWMFDRAPVSHAGGDSLWIVHTSASLITDGDLDLSEYSAVIDAYSQPPPHLMDIESQRLDFFPWGSAVVIAPFVAGHAVATNVAGGDFAEQLDDRLPLREIENNLASAVAAVTAGLLLVLLYLRTKSVAWATALALTFALATGVMSTTSRNLWIQGPGLLLVVGILLAGQVLSEREGELRRVDFVLVAGAGMLVALAYATRPPLALLGPVMLVLAWDRGRWRLASTLAGAALAGLVAFVLVNLGLYDSYTTPYNEQNSDLIEFGGSFPEAFAAHLVSPSRGLFVWMPMLLVGVVWCLLRWRETTTFERLLLAWIGAHLVAISAFAIWWGGASVGPRLALDIVPALFVLLTRPIDALRTMSDRSRRSLLALLAVATLWAGFVNIRAGYRTSVMLWNWPSPTNESIEDDPGRVWDWSDPQFLR